MDENTQEISDRLDELAMFACEVHLILTHKYLTMPQRLFMIKHLHCKILNTSMEYKNIMDLCECSLKEAENLRLFWNNQNMASILLTEENE